jgi:galactokinase/mevalonate kinase-like predicted kinase
LAKAAFSLAGFHPRFRSDSARELPEILEHFGGGIEVSLLAATPKGSGLGTSSVLAATILGALASAGELGWDHEEIFQRTLALEQLLTSGGGWQDQAGGIYHGVKLVETPPGLLQRPTVKWLPERLFGPVVANRVALLYYTGITRVAKTILQEIVRGMFLNSAPHLDKLAAIGANAQSAYQAIQRGSYEDLCGVIRRSWHLNQALDAGTNPPEVQRILDRVQDFTSASKLLGAGGGGYMLLLAKDESAAARIRSTLESDRPNARARFVDFSLSGNGLQITRS